LSLPLPLIAVPHLLAPAVTGTIRGRITNAADGRALPDAQVTVTGTRLGVVSSANGEYTLANVAAGPRSETVRRPGYEPVTRPVVVTAGEVATADVALQVSALNLAEVVVTGSAMPTEKKKIGTSVAAVDSTLISRAQAVTVDQAIQEIPGAQITPEFWWAGTAPANRAASVVIDLNNVALAGATGRTIVTADNNVGGAPVRAFLLTDR
jgi:TonB-dependent starch-binding outer membrane protein SusC